MNADDLAKEAILRSNPVIYYKKWKIFLFVLPLHDGRWSANGEIEAVDGDEPEMLQNTSRNFVSTSKLQALHLACEDAKIQIDDILADPIG